MTDFLADEGWGEGIGVEVVWLSIPLAGEESRAGLTGAFFPQGWKSRISQADVLGSVGES